MPELAWPYLMLLLPLPWLAARLLRPAADTGAALSVPPRLGRALLALPQPPDRVGRLAQGLRWLLWAALLLAAAQPRQVLEAQALPVTGRDIFLAVDLSRSMRQQDFELDGAVTDRLTVVKQVAGDFLRAREGDRIGLVVFADEAFVAAPLSFDNARVAYLLDEVEIGLAGGATALGDALGLTLRKLRDSDAVTRTVILLSDGANNSGTVEPLSAAALAGELDVRVYTIAIGAEDRVAETASGQRTIAPAVNLDVETLQEIARVTDGRFFRVRTTAELRRVYDTLDRLEPTELLAPPVTRVRDLVPLCLALALAAALALAGLERRRAR